VDLKRFVKRDWGFMHKRETLMNQNVRRRARGSA